MELKWIKMDTGMFGTNRAVRQIEGMADGDSLLVIWFKLLLLAGRTADGGRIELIPGVPTTPEMLAVELARPQALVARALSVFSAYGMLDEAQMRVVGFAESQGGKSTEARGIAAEKAGSAATAEKVATAEKAVTVDKAGAEECPATPTESPTGATERDAEAEARDAEDALLARHEEEQKKRTFLGGTLGKGVLLLSPAQLDDLVERLSLEELERYAGVVVECEKSGKRFTKRTHYDAILDMAEKDRRVTPRRNG